MTESDPPQGPGLPEDARLDSLDERLSRAKQAEAVRTGTQRPDPNTRLGQRVLGELIGAPFGGGLIGWLLDRWLGTSPWLLLSLLFLGFAVGVRNVIRLSRTPPGNGPGAG
ncbi:MAG: atpI [Alphaproteobacteria bacterium]|nr:atpI [Alphaproteobacteria bacterium]